MTMMLWDDGKSKVEVEQLIADAIDSWIVLHGEHKE